jgi:2-succinyl-5-enolpyruvyl-6-hydroxy-3-cyclohexene-1-carboxylate synthase
LADTNLKYDPYESKPKWSHSINESLIIHPASDHSFLLSWETLFKKQLNHIETAFKEETMLNELSAIGSFLALLPAQSVLHIANSMSIRYVAFWGLSTAVNCMSNRGTSGIDGCLSTAVGAALAAPNLKHFVLIGDLAFFYDSNALWTPEIPPNLHIVLLNNKGGMIFNMIPGPAQSVAHPQITSPHNLNAEFICKGYGVDYTLVKNQTEWSEVLPKFMSHSKANLLEIQTSTENNIRIWNKLKM